MGILLQIVKQKVIVLILLLIPSSLFSQEHYLGVRGAYSMSAIRFKPYQGEPKGVSGTDFGIVYKLYAEKVMGTQIELNSVQKGYELTTISVKEENGVTTTTTEEKKYSGKAVELPIMAQGSLRFGGFRVLVNAGVFGSYLLSQEKAIKKIDESGNWTMTKTDSFEDRDKRFEYGILGGGGFAFQLKKVELQVEARYQYSLGYAQKPRYKKEDVIFANRSHLAFSVALFYNL